MTGGAVTDPSSPADDGGADRGGRRSWRRRLLLVLLLLMVVAGVVVAWLPSLASSGWGTSLLVNAVSRRIAGRVEIEGLRLAWGAGQSVQRVRLLGADGTVALELDAVDAPALSIASLVRGGTDLGTVAAARLAADQDRVSAALRPSAPPRGKGGRDPTRNRGGTPSDPTPVPWLVCLEVAEASLTFGSGGTDPVRVAAADIVVDRSSAADLSVRGAAEVRQGALAGTASLDVELSELFDEQSVLRPGRLVPRKLKLVADVVPTALLDRMMGTGGLLTRLLGPILDARFEASGADLNDFGGTIALRSDHLSMTGRVRNAEGKVELTSTDAARLSITREAYDALSGRWPALAETRLKETVGATMRIAALSIPIVDEALDLREAQVALTVALEAASVDAGAMGTFGVRGTEITVTSDALGRAVTIGGVTTASHEAHAGALKIDLLVEDLFDAQRRVNTDGIRGRMQLEASGVPVGFVQRFVAWPPGVLGAVGASVDAAAVVDYSGADAEMPVKVTVRSSDLKASLEGRRTGEGRWEFRGAAVLEGRPRLAQAWIDHYAVHLPEAVRGFVLRDTMGIRVVIDTLEVDGGLNPATLVVAGRLNVDGVALGGVNALEDLELRDVVVKVPRSTVGRSLRAVFTARLLHGGRAGEVEVSASVERPLGERAVNANVRLAGLDVADLERRLGLAGDLVPYLGETVQRLQLTVRPEQEAWGFEGAASSDLLTVPRVTGRYQPDRRLTAEAMGSVYRLKPSVANSLLSAGSSPPAGASPPLALREAVDLRLDVERLDVPMEPGTDGRRNIDWCRAVLKLRGGGDAVPLMAVAAKGPRRLTWWAPKLAIDAVPDRLEIEIGGALEAVDPATGATGTTPMTSRTRVRNLFGGGADPAAALTFETETKFPDMPVEIVDGLLGSGGKLTSVIGASAAVEVVGMFPGALTLRLQSDRAKVNLATRTTRQNDRYVVELLDENVAELRPDEEGFRVVLGEVHPVFSDVVAVREPIRLTVKRDPFVLPLDFEEGWVNRLELDMTIPRTTLSMRRRGWLTEAIGTLADEARRIARALRSAKASDAGVGTYEATFSPLRVVVKEGRITTSELWIISEDLALGFQGGADLHRQRYRFFMGLVGASLLAEEPMLVQIVDPANIYDVPVTGDLGGDPVIDKKELATALVGSAAKQQLAGRVGDVGVLVDQLILKPEQDKRRRKLGLTWNMPEEARQFIARTLEEMSAQSAEKRREAPEEERQVGEPGERRPTTVEDVVKDEINRALEGLFNR